MPPEADDATFSAGVWQEYAAEDLGVAERGGGAVPTTGLPELQSYAAMGRYPGPYEPPPEDAEQALVCASALVSVVRSAVAPPDAAP